MEINLRTAGLVPTRATSTITATSSDTVRFYRDSVESGTPGSHDFGAARPGETEKSHAKTQRRKGKTKMEIAVKSTKRTKRELC